MLQAILHIFSILHAQVLAVSGTQSISLLVWKMISHSDDAKRISEAGLEERWELGRKAPHSGFGIRRAAEKQMPHGINWEGDLLGARAMLHRQLFYKRCLQHATATPVCSKHINGVILKGCHMLLSLGWQDAELHVSTCRCCICVAHTS